jgi:hypothetical protein
LKEIDMSAPDTNIEKQKQRHKPVAWGLWAGIAITLAVVIVLAVVFNLFGVSYTEVVPPSDAG